ncbi:hypothetical protein E2542_SST18239 [Spatholobus suberectus]|nr:hypothetical protein E2542_SST18239 [Spatholobus suberectus]
MALDGKKGEDMDSLFEGMVLFNPAQNEAELGQDKDNGSDDFLQYRQSDADALSTSCSQSQPLDENLFSDLTLVVDPLQNLEVAEVEHDLQSPQPSISASAPTSSRQAPRRRKRSGLRIGYGRDALFPNDLPHSHTPSPLPQPIISHSDSLGDAVLVRDTLPFITTALPLPLMMLMLMLMLLLNYLLNLPPNQRMRLGNTKMILLFLRQSFGKLRPAYMRSLTMPVNW